jgi:flagellar biosynthesis/type III secretory pathway protein FliH
MTTDQRLDEREQRRKADQQFREKLVDEIATEYDFGLSIAKACVDKGWEDGHSAGYSEVRAQAEIAADFAEKILKIIGRA